MFQTVMVAAEWINIQPIKDFICDYNRKLEHRREIRTTIDELHRLTDKELVDIGISRGEIYSIAHGTSDHPAVTKIGGW